MPHVIVCRFTLQFADAGNGVDTVVDAGKGALFDENEDDEDYDEEQQHELLEDEEIEEGGVAPAVIAAAVEPSLDDRKAMLAKLVAKKKREAVSVQRLCIEAALLETLRPL